MMDERTLVDLGSPSEAEDMQDPALAGPPPVDDAPFDEIILSEHTLIRKPDHPPLPSLDEKTIVQGAEQDLGMPKPPPANAIDELFDARTVVVGRPREKTVVSGLSAPPPSHAPKKTPQSEQQSAGKAAAGDLLGRPPKPPLKPHEARAMREQTPDSETPPSVPSESQWAIRGGAESNLVPPPLEPLEGASTSLGFFEGENAESEEDFEVKPTLVQKIKVQAMVLRERALIFWQGLTPDKRKKLMIGGATASVGLLVLLALSGTTHDDAAEVGDEAVAVQTEHEAPTHKTDMASIKAAEQAPSGDAAAPAPPPMAKAPGPEAVLGQFDQAFNRTQEQVYPKSR
jgi:hypothetical protein